MFATSDPIYLSIYIMYMSVFVYVFVKCRSFVVQTFVFQSYTKCTKLNEKSEKNCFEGRDWHGKCYLFNLRD